MDNLNVKYVDIDSVIQDPQNSRLHSPEQLEYIAKSLSRFSQQKPIVVGKDGVIIAGNGTHQAAKEILNWDTIAVVYSELTAEEARAYSISDNSIAEQSTWNVDILSTHIEEMKNWSPDIDWGSMGFEKNTIAEIIGNTDKNIHQDMLDASQITTSSIPNNSTKPQMAKAIKVTEDQRTIIDRAVASVRVSESDPNMSEGRALELICADFMS
jgi:ParB-like nuclease domain